MDDEYFKECSRREEVVKILAEGILELLLNERQQKMSNRSRKQLNGACGLSHKAGESGSKQRRRIETSGRPGDK
jgi:hypothetical protein